MMRSMQMLYGTNSSASIGSSPMHRFPTILNSHAIHYPSGLIGISRHTADSTPGPDQSVWKLNSPETSLRIVRSPNRRWGFLLADTNFGMRTALRVYCPAQESSGRFWMLNRRAFWPSRPASRVNSCNESRSVFPCRRVVPWSVFSSPTDGRRGRPTSRARWCWFPRASGQRAFRSSGSHHRSNPLPVDFGRDRTLQYGN